MEVMRIVWFFNMLLSFWLLHRSFRLNEKAGLAYEEAISDLESAKTLLKELETEKRKK